MKTIILLLLTAAVLTAAPSVNLPLEHWAYPFLERLEAKGLISGGELRVRPLPRAVAADLVEQAVINARQKPSRLTTSDRLLLEQLQSDLSEESAGRPTLASFIEPEPHLYSYRDADTALHLDLVGRQTIISNRGTETSELLSKTTAGAQLRGSWGTAWAFFAEAHNTLTRGENRDPNDENYDPDKGEPVGISGANVYRDRATAYLVWQKSHLRFEAGKDEFDWGPFYGGGAALSSNAPPADLLRLALRTQRFKFTFMHAWLRSSFSQKYLAAHRLDARLVRGVYVGFSETVVYAGRALEPSYLNPLMLYHIAEHHLGDRDNNNLCLDAAITRIPNLTLKAEWYIDDMTLTKSRRNYFGNKFAWSVGGLWADAFFVDNVDLTVRYVKISPYVYTHWDLRNIYTHYDKIIGNELGPNADEISLTAGRRFGRDFHAELSFRHTRKGSGAANTETRPPIGDRKDFLSGIVEQRSLIGIRLVDQVRRDLYITLSYAYQDVRNREQIPGGSSHDHLVRLQIDWNY